MLICEFGLMLIKNPLARSDSMIPYGRQDITQVDIDAVVDVLRSDFLTQGQPCHVLRRRSPITVE